MDRGNIGRWLLIAAGVFLLLTFLPKFFQSSAALQPLKPEGVVTATDSQRPPEKLCDIWTDDFHAQLSSRSASLKHFQLLRSKYRKSTQPTDLSTTPQVELRRQLRLEYMNLAAAEKFQPRGVKDDEWQIPLQWVSEKDKAGKDKAPEPVADVLDYELAAATGKSCEFVFRNDRTEIRETIQATAKPYELEIETTVRNLAARPLSHAVIAHSDVWRTEHEIASGMFRVSPLATHVECVADNGKTTRLLPTDFEADDFKKPEEFPRTPLSLGDWHQAPGKPGVASVSNAYFSNAIVPLSAPVAPVCQLQIEDRWDPRTFQSKSADPNGGAMYRARLTYPVRELKPGESATYSLLSYVGPKERSVLAQAGGGKTQLLELIDLGFFSAIAKVLVGFLLKVHSVIPNWGVAIIVLTLTARTLLFPLALPGIRNMIRMRELKPELDLLNEKFKNDAQAKGLAQMELWRKHNVNPLKGCLPQLASMPVWFALYTTLQTAVELYNIPFLWFPDLSAADPLYILPFIIGATSFIQQRMMPQQGGDPTQQKMMLYFMPAMFTVFMLFLPAGLGVYMFTNGVLGILQQQAVEWHARRTLDKGGPGAGNIKVKVVEESRAGSGKEKPKAALGGKAKRDVSETGGDSEHAVKMTGSERLLGKGRTS